MEIFTRSWKCDTCCWKQETNTLVQVIVHQLDLLLLQTLSVQMDVIWFPPLLWWLRLLWWPLLVRTILSFFLQSITDNYIYYLGDLKALEAPPPSSISCTWHLFTLLFCCFKQKSAGDISLGSPISQLTLLWKWDYYFFCKSQAAVPKLLQIIAVNWFTRNIRGPRLLRFL